MRLPTKLLYYFGLYEFFMIVEDTIQHSLNFCQAFPPPIVALHLHLPHTLYCVARNQPHPWHAPFRQEFWLPRFGISFDVWGLEPFVPGVHPVPLWLSYLLGVFNLMIAGWAITVFLRKVWIHRVKRGSEARTSSSDAAEGLDIGEA